MEPSETLSIIIKAKNTVGFRYREVSMDSFPLVNAENAEVWSRFLAKRIGDLISEESMSSEDYVAFEREYAAELRWEAEAEARLQKNREDYEYRKKLGRKTLGYVPDGLKLDYNKIYGDYADRVFKWHPRNADDFMYQVRSIERICQASAARCIDNGRPDAAYAQAYEVCRRLPVWMSGMECGEYVDAYRNRLRKTVVECYSGAVNAALAWNNIEKLKEINALICSHSARYAVLGLKPQKIISLCGDENIKGEPTEVKRNPNRDEYLEQLAQARYEQHRVAEAAERKSLIPLNEDYEANIFGRFKYDCDYIAALMADEERRIHSLCENKQYAEGALRLMQLVKSMCRHFVSDEHYNYFDDLYVPEYVINDLVRYFNELIQKGVVPDEVRSFLRSSSEEIMSSEAAKEYGIPRRLF